MAAILISQAKLFLVVKLNFEIKLMMKKSEKFMQCFDVIIASLSNPFI